MSDLFLYAIASIFAYIFTLPGIIYANEKPTKIRRALLVLIIVAVGLLNGLALKRKENTIPVDAVEKAWGEYEKYCKQEPEEELTFPEWLGIEASRP
jgi:hypothetical protein